MHNQIISKDELVLLGLGSANHDQERFSEPDKFDINRHNSHHLAFGHGLHGCIGAPLFRMLAPIAIDTTISRLDRLRLETDSPDWVLDASLRRTLNSMPVAWSVTSQ